LERIGLDPETLKPIGVAAPVVAKEPPVSKASEALKKVKKKASISMSSGFKKEPDKEVSDGEAEGSSAGNDSD